jgi:hypothetical protein
VSHVGDSRLYTIYMCGAPVWFLLQSGSRPDIVHCVRGGPPRPPAGCGNVQDSDDDEARGQRGDRWGGAAAAAVKRISMNDRGKFGSQSKIQSGSAFLKQALNIEQLVSTTV